VKNQSWFMSLSVAALSSTALFAATLDFDHPVAGLRSETTLPTKWIAARVQIGTAKGAKSVLPHLAQSQDQRKPASALEPCAQPEFQSTVWSGRSRAISLNVQGSRQQRFEPRLLKVPVASEGFRESLILHHDKGNAVGEGPVLIGPASE
jgi:hypothetical protein